jgi:hypothetical protein
MSRAVYFTDARVAVMTMGHFGNELEQQWPTMVTQWRLDH